MTTVTVMVQLSREGPIDPEDARQLLVELIHADNPDHRGWEIQVDDEAYQEDPDDGDEIFENDS